MRDPISHPNPLVTAAGMQFGMPHVTAAGMLVFAVPVAYTDAGGYT